MRVPRGLHLEASVRVQVGACNDAQLFPQYARENLRPPHGGYRQSSQLTPLLWGKFADSPAVIQDG